MSPHEPALKKAVVFVDGQNLYRAVKDAFGYHHPNYNIKLLSEKVCSDHNWNLVGIHFYTGVPDPQGDPLWHTFWSRKLSYMGRLGIELFRRPLRYHNEEFTCPSCHKMYTSLVGHEKGVDVRLAKVASVFPMSPTVKNTAGINGTEWIRIDKKTYDACIDPADYRNLLEK